MPLVPPRSNGPSLDTQFMREFLCAVSWLKGQQMVTASEDPRTPNNGFCGDSVIHVPPDRSRFE